MIIKRSDLTEPAITDLLALHHAEMVAGSPPGTCHVLDLSGLKVPEVAVYGVWDGEQDDAALLAIGALKHHADFAELKSMRAHPDARGKGAGTAMLTHLLQTAKTAGFIEVKLETGNGPLFEAAVGLYRSFGFEDCAPFAGYTPGDFTQLMALKLEA